MSALQQLVYTVISYPCGRWAQPRGCATPPKMWKNCPTLSSSLSPETELFVRNAARTNRDHGDQSPGKPIAPVQRPPTFSGSAGAKRFTGSSGESA